MKRYHHGHRLQFYMYYFMYMFPETMVDEEYFPETTSFFLKTTIKIQRMDQCQITGLVLVTFVYKTTR